MDAIGIDLGTSNCCVAVVKNGRPEVIINKQGKRTTPSYITFWKDEIVFGSVAKNRYTIEPKNTIHDVKRFIGLDFSSAMEESSARKWRFDLINKSGTTMVHVNTKTGAKFYRPEELSGLLLKELKSDAENYLGHEVCNAVITVPTYFNDSQRQATIDAGRIAGFETIRLLNESTSAAIAYATENSLEEKTVLIFDCGGGTFDVSIVKLKEKQVRVLAIHGDLNLGGNNVDTCLLEYCVSHIMQKFQFDVHSDHRMLFRLRSLCESVKSEFSSSEDAILELDKFLPDQDEELVLTLNRSEFDIVCRDIYDKAISIVDECIARTNLDKSDIDDVVLVGGSTKIRGLVSKLKDYFNFLPKRTINPDEAVAVGAAIQASVLFGGGGGDGYSELVLNNLTPYDLGVETEGGEMSVIVPRDCQLPARNHKVFCTTKDNQQFIVVKIFSGNSNQTKDNIQLGSLKVSGFPLGPRGAVKLKETFEVDENGILIVSVVDLSTGSSYGLEISLDKGRMSEEDIVCGRESVSQDYQQIEDTRRFKLLKSSIINECNRPEVSNKYELDDILQWLKEVTLDSIEDMERLLKDLQIP